MPDPLHHRQFRRNSRRTQPVTQDLLLHSFALAIASLALLSRTVSFLVRNWRVIAPIVISVLFGELMWRHTSSVCDVPERLRSWGHFVFVVAPLCIVHPYVRDFIDSIFPPHDNGAHHERTNGEQR
jgi:hypothetical protein